MRRFLFLLILLATCSVAAFAENQIEPPISCKQCGMDRTVFNQSRTLISYADGGSVGTCSIHCVAAELRENQAKKVKGIQVADCKTRTLIDARNAVWVIGGKKSGVMTEVGKWAFAHKEDAEAFRATNGGKLSDFDEALELSRKELD
jgi:nitrous oxide reductase accessory protein NosL